MESLMKTRTFVTYHTKSNNLYVTCKLTPHQFSSLFSPQIETPSCNPLSTKREHTTTTSNTRRRRSSCFSFSSYLFLCSMKDSVSGRQNSGKPSNPVPSLPKKPGGECTSLKTHECFGKEAPSQGKIVDDNGKETGGWEEVNEDYGRERLKRHRIEVAGRVWIPEIWGQEELLQDWTDCSAFDACLVPNGIVSARASLVDEGRRANATGLRIENSC